jgi:hypothetical protein
MLRVGRDRHQRLGRGLALIGAGSVNPRCHLPCSSAPTR